MQTPPVFSDVPGKERFSFLPEAQVYSEFVCNANHHV